MKTPYSIARKTNLFFRKAKLFFAVYKNKTSKSFKFTKKLCTFAAK